MRMELEQNLGARRRTIRVPTGWHGQVACTGGAGTRQPLRIRSLILRPVPARTIARLPSSRIQRAPCAPQAGTVRLRSTSGVDMSRTHQVVSAERFCSRGVESLVGDGSVGRVTLRTVESDPRRPQSFHVAQKLCCETIFIN